jgi:hypothetical protein
MKPRHRTKLLFECLVPGIMMLVLIVPAISSAKDSTLPPGVSIEGELGLGYDSNPIREPLDPNQEPYFPFDLELGYKKNLDPASRLRFFLEAGGELYQSSRVDGGTRRYEADLYYDRRLVGGKRGYVRSPSLDFELRGFVDRVDRTFFSRTAGEEFTVTSVSGPVSLRDRFDAFQFGGSLETTLRYPRNTRWSVEFKMRHRNYLHDYEELPDVYPLDYDSRRWEFRVTQELSDVYRLEVEYTRRDKDYDAWVARDLDGDRVPGIIQTFDYNSLATSLEADYPDVGRFSLGFEYKTRTDGYVGYYDYAEWSVVPGVRLSLFPWAEIDAEYDFRFRDYERARVGFNPANPVREDTDHAFSLEILHWTGRNGAMFARVEAEDVNEENPTFTYSRARTIVGYSFEY